jgi:1-acyl-sn-glycerol-3-phosphate acyltransferase
MAMTNEEAHALSRKRGTSKLIYGTARVVLTPLCAVWYRFKVTGSEYVPKEGAAIIAPNHKSFYDSFFVGLATRRHLHFMAKTELFEGRSARLLSGLGAFPVRRGEADPAALETARLHLDQGRVLALFPEGTRHRDPEQLRAPRKGAGRLAIEAQVPIVPCAITGTDRLFKGWIPRPVKVQVSFAPAIQPAQLEATPEAAADLIQNQVWPEVEREFARLKSTPGVLAAILAALSAGGGIAYQAQRKPPKRKVVLNKLKLGKSRKKKGPFRR